MKKEPRVAFSVVGGAMLLALLLGFLSLSAYSQATVPHEQTSPQTQSITGKITSVEKSSFTLSVATAVSNPGHQLLQTASAKSMTFVVDKNTTIDGKLQVGATADVTYREDAGRNIAITVKITQ